MLILNIARNNIAFAQQSTAARPTIGIVPAEDRWITLTDGTRVYQGVEISYLLTTSLMATGKYNTILLPPAQPAAQPSLDRLANVPPAWIPPTTYSAFNSIVQPMEITITPIVERFEPGCCSALKPA